MHEKMLLTPVYPLLTVSHQSYDRLAARFAARIRPCSRSQTKWHTPSRFSLNVRLPLFDAHRSVLPSRAGLSPDVLSELQDCRKCGCTAVMRTSRAVIQFVTFLWQLCNKAKGHCMVIVWQSCGICRQNNVSCSSLAAVFRPHKIARESQGK